MRSNDHPQAAVKMSGASGLNGVLSRYKVGGCINEQGEKAASNDHAQAAGRKNSMSRSAKRYEVCATSRNGMGVRRKGEEQGHPRW
jgi:hypothetical protein